MTKSRLILAHLSKTWGPFLIVFLLISIVLIGIVAVDALIGAAP